MNKELEELPISQTYVTRANELDSAGKDSTAARYRLTPGLVLRLATVMINIRRWASEMDLIKKHIFYGKPLDRPTFDEFEALDGTEVLQGMTRLDNHEMIRVLHAISGIVDESGELVDMFFKFLFEGQIFDWDNLHEEVGDELWYLALLARACGHHTFDEFMTGNMAKLEARYGGTWNQDGALNRDTDAEMNALNNAIKVEKGDPLSFEHVREDELSALEADGDKALREALREDMDYPEGLPQTLHGEPSDLIDPDDQQTRLG